MSDSFEELLRRGGAPQVEVYGLKTPTKPVGKKSVPPTSYGQPKKPASKLGRLTTVAREVAPALWVAFALALGGAISGSTGFALLAFIPIGYAAWGWWKSR